MRGENGGESSSVNTPFTARSGHLPKKYTSSKRRNFWENLRIELCLIPIWIHYFKNGEHRITGAGRIVETDATALVFGFIDGKNFIEAGELRDANTLLEVIKWRIADGGMIYSEWQISYSYLEQEGYQKLTVHHWAIFKGSDPGAYTQHIERVRRVSSNAVPKFDRKKANWSW